DNEHQFCVCLIECIDDFTWDEDKLWALYWYYNHEFHEGYGYRTAMWLMNGSEVMKMGFNVAYGSDSKLDIIISEGTGKYNVKRPIQINPDMLVLSLHMLIMLMYTFSFLIQPLFKLNIHNQCLNVVLASLTYITDDLLVCHRVPDHKVYAGDTMRSGFIIK